jgi:hypothetical protein
MVPTIQVGDRILVLKAFFNWHDLHEATSWCSPARPAITAAGRPMTTWSSAS